MEANNPFRLNSDHALIETVISLELHEDNHRRPRYNQIPKEEYNRDLKEQLQRLGFPTLSTCEEADDYARGIFASHTSATTVHLPNTEPFCHLQPGKSVAMQKSDSDLKSAVRKVKDNPGPENREYLRVCKSTRKRLVKLEDMVSFREHLQEITTNSKGLFAMARWEKDFGVIRAPIRMEDLVQDRLVDSGQLPRQHLEHEDNDSDDGYCQIDICTEPETKIDCLHAQFFPSPDTAIHQTSMDETKRQFVWPRWPTPFTSNPVATQAELHKMIKALQSTSSPGLDKFPNVLLKLCRTTIVPHLEHLFHACLRLGYHPASFKSALTIVLRKPGSTGSYRNAKKWRPIALLSCIGKLLGSVFARRLKYHAISFKLGPRS